MAIGTRSLKPLAKSKRYPTLAGGEGVKYSGLAGRIGALELAVKRDPKAQDLRLALGEAWLEAGEWQRAIAVLSRVKKSPSLARKAAKAIAKAKAMGDEPRAPAQYVRHLFDQFAAKYDAHMMERLSYRAPQVLRSLAGLIGLGMGGKFSILDLGCGTGLCGAAFTDLASRLDGVDLSPGMMEKAKARKLYSRLIRADLESALAREKRRYGLIVAADTLVYLGDLEAIFRLAAKRLTAGGIFLFTVETKRGRGYDLTKRRRYRHSEAYLRQCAAQAELEIAGLIACSPRQDAGKPVKGLALALQRI
jgi:predicted TPR repeat methyltransferase